MAPKISEFKFLALMGFVVLLLGAQTFRDTFGDELSASAEPAGESLRQPASLPEARPAPVPKKASVSAADALMEWNWNCETKPATEASVPSNYLRLKGRACGDLEVSAEKLTLTNETNGFTASVFAKGKTSYETDLIQLRAGPNRIRVQYVNSTGRRIESFLTVISKVSVL